MKYVVCQTDELPPGTRRIVDIDGRSVGVFNVDGEYYALRNTCPHQGGELCAGSLLGSVASPRPGEYHYDASRKLLQCPWHGWEFDIATGQSWFDPKRTRVRPYDVTVESGESITADGELAEGPYVAETLRVAVEDEYIVVIP